MAKATVVLDTTKARRQIDRESKRLYANADGVLIEAKDVLHDRIVELAPEDTGALLAHVYVEVARGRRGPVLKAGVNDLAYPVYVEFGTRNVAAQPFLRPALAEMPGFIKRRVR